MLLAYTVNRSIIIALDNSANHLIVKIKNSQKVVLATYEFYNTDFEKINFETNERMLFLELILDGQKEERKLFFN